MNQKRIIQDLLIEFKTLKPDIAKFDGNPAPALAEKLIIIINKMTPHAHLFDDNFKIKIKEYILTYEAAKQGKKKGKKIFELIEPTSKLIDTTLTKKLKEFENE